jgi:hypothetical protein
MICILLSVYNSVIRATNTTMILYLQNEDKIDTNLPTFPSYAQALRYRFQPFLSHHQASHKNIKLSSSIELLL